MAQADNEYTLKITGKPAVAVIALIIAFVLWRLLVTHTEVSPDIEEQVRSVLVAEYARSLLPCFQEGATARDEARLEEDLERLETYTKKITFSSLSRRGGGGNVCVRATILVDGKAPPVGKSVRYFLFNHSLITGYVFQQETFALDYYLPFFN